MKVKAGIYCIENKTNKKKYIGKSVDAKRRLRIHKYKLRHNKHFNDHLASAWNYYGENCFEFKVLCSVPSEKQLNFYEMFLINFYQTNKKEFGYNQSLGGDGGIGRKLSKEHKRKISEANKGRAGPRGIKLSQEHKDKISKNHARHMLGKTHTAVTKKKMSNSQKQRYADPKEREKVSVATKKAMQRPEVKRRLSESHMGFSHSEGTKKKLSRISKSRWEDESFRERNIRFGSSHPGFLKNITFSVVVNSAKQNNFIKESVVKHLGVSRDTVAARIKSAGYKTWKEFCQKYNEKQNIDSV